MMWRWLPWRWIVRRAARVYGLADPLRVLARMRRFSQPSEVAEPLELLRAGMIFHARGLVNTKAIQHNLDWVWPYWVVRQFDPSDPSFIPRAFSFSHVNLTHRNWTAVGLPDSNHYPIVDPRGLVTPLHDGWSLDCWIVGHDGSALLPSHLASVEQILHMEPRLRLQTVARDGERRIESVVELVRDEAGRLQVVLAVRANGRSGDRLVLAVRPYNPEGIQFIDRLAATDGGIEVNGHTRIRLDSPPETVRLETYAVGDVFHSLLDQRDGGDEEVHCSTGMATGAAIYSLPGHGEERFVRASVPIAAHGRVRNPAQPGDWERALAGSARLQVPDRQMRFLHEAAAATLVLLSAEDILPGPYTYRRFWFRDACLIGHALLCLGQIERVRAAFDRFPDRQRASGYFQSQEGEWDANGEVLWAYGRFAALTGETLPGNWLAAMNHGVRWIRHKRLGEEAGAGIAGLLPAGFSAEHLGPNDYYYWDDWWALAGLHAAACELGRAGRVRQARRAREEARSLDHAIRRSIDGIANGRNGDGIPAAPFRRMDAGAIGSLVADYPLQLTAPADRRIMATVEYLLEHSFHDRGFMQNMIHSGINAYLTLDIAQTLLRAGRPERAWPLVRAVAEKASPTGQWPEAIHPLTGGGCMGDGQHAWAAAEWVMVMRALFIREEGEGLVIGSGLPPEWIRQRQRLGYGPTQTCWGPAEVILEPAQGGYRIRVDGAWRRTPPRLHACVPGFRECDLAADGTATVLVPTRQ